MSRHIRRDSMGSAPLHHDSDGKVESLTYSSTESAAHHAYLTLEHLQNRSRFLNTSHKSTTHMYLLTALVGACQAVVAYFMKFSSSTLIASKYQHVYGLLEDGRTFQAFLYYVTMQTCYAFLASMCVFIEPISSGSGIPEVKIFLNGIDLPNVGALKTLVCKTVGVICSVTAGLPVGSEGPMVHSGSVVATTLSSNAVRNDREVRDYVAIGAACGVCTAFSAPIGGILFALEEGASYWGPTLTWRCFLGSMVALTTLLCLNSIGSTLGKVGFNKLFSFGNFIYEGNESSFAVYELFVFIAIGMIGGIIGAIFNNTNEHITRWIIKNVNHSKKRRVLEVLGVSLGVSVVSFLLPMLWTRCTPLPTNPMPHEEALLEELVTFRCEPGKEYNEIASLIFTEAGVAIRQLFHLHKKAFTDVALIIFFLVYISLAVVVYGIGVPSGLFVPSLLSGAAFGRLFGNQAARHWQQPLAFSNTYALVGAAAVLGGMARMTISLTVILLEATGNEQYVLPLMLTLMSARLTGAMFNDDLYHIHIHLKKGVKFLEAELTSVKSHTELVAGQVMGENVIFLRLVEKVGTILDILRSTRHTTFPVVDEENDGVLYGTISRSELCVLLKHRAFGLPRDDSIRSSSMVSNHVTVGDEKFLPILGWTMVESSYPKYPSVKEIRISPAEERLWVDLRPYSNTAPVSIQETASIERTYEVFRSLGLRFLPVVNRRNQVVGTITRDDLSTHGLTHSLLT